MGSMFFYAKYTIRENSYFSELLPSGGCQKRQKALKTLRFLYGGSSIHWPPKPILSSPIFSHLFPFKFFPYISILIFISHICSPYFFVIKKFFSYSNLFYHLQFHTIRKKNFFTCQSKSQESSIISHLSTHLF